LGWNSIIFADPGRECQKGIDAGNWEFSGHTFISTDCAYDLMQTLK
jgi:hypothetical protein